MNSFLCEASLSDSKIDISPMKLKDPITDDLESTPIHCNLNKTEGKENSEIQCQNQTDQNMDSILINDNSKQEELYDACQSKQLNSQSIKSLQKKGTNVPGSPEKSYLKANNENTTFFIPLGKTTKNAIILAKNATISDKNRHYGDACILYENAVGLFLQALELEPLNTKNTKDTIQALCKQLQCREKMLKLFGRPAPKFAKPNDEIQPLLDMLEESEPKIDGNENNSIIENLGRSSLNEIENNVSDSDLGEENTKKTEEKEKIRKDPNCERINIKEAKYVQKMPEHILEPLDIKGQKISKANCGFLNSSKEKKISYTALMV
jgi:hypothetical protein